MDNKSIIFFKLYKYFCITINSFDQLRDLKKDIKKLNKSDFSLITSSIDKAFPNETLIMKKFISWEFNKFYKNKDINKFFLNLKKIRQNKRLIFNGKLNFKNVFFLKNFIYALFLDQKLNGNIIITPCQQLQ